MLGAIRSARTRLAGLDLHALGARRHAALGAALAGTPGACLLLGAERLALLLDGLTLLQLAGSGEDALREVATAALLLALGDGRQLTVVELALPRTGHQRVQIGRITLARQLVLARASAPHDLRARDAHATQHTEVVLVTGLLRALLSSAKLLAPRASEAPGDALVTTAVRGAGLGLLAQRAACLLRGRDLGLRRLLGLPRLGERAHLELHAGIERGPAQTSAVGDHLELRWRVATVLGAGGKLLDRRGLLAAHEVVATPLHALQRHTADAELAEHALLVGFTGVAATIVAVLELPPGASVRPAALHAALLVLISGLALDRLAAEIPALPLRGGELRLLGLRGRGIRLRDRGSLRCRLGIRLRHRRCVRLRRRLRLGHRRLRGLDRGLRRRRGLRGHGDRRLEPLRHARRVRLAAGRVMAGQLGLEHGPVLLAPAGAVCNLLVGHDRVPGAADLLATHGRAAHLAAADLQTLQHARVEAIPARPPVAALDRVELSRGGGVPHAAGQAARTGRLGRALTELAAERLALDLHRVDLRRRRDRRLVQRRGEAAVERGPAALAPTAVHREEVAGHGRVPGVHDLQARASALVEHLHVVRRATALQLLLARAEAQIIVAAEALRDALGEPRATAATPQLGVQVAGLLRVGQLAQALGLALAEAADIAGASALQPALAHLGAGGLTAAQTSRHTRLDRHAARRAQAARPGLFGAPVLRVRRVGRHQAGPHAGLTGLRVAGLTVALQALLADGPAHALPGRRLLHRSEDALVVRLTARLRQTRCGRAPGLRRKGVPARERLHALVGAGVQRLAVVGLAGAEQLLVADVDAELALLRRNRRRRHTGRWIRGGVAPRRHWGELNRRGRGLSACRHRQRKRPRQSEHGGRREDPAQSAFPISLVHFSTPPRRPARQTMSPSGDPRLSVLPYGVLPSRRGSGKCAFCMIDVQA